jgi:hypothetical protein
MIAAGKIQEAIDRWEQPGVKHLVDDSWPPILSVFQKGLSFSGSSGAGMTSSRLAVDLSKPYHGTQQRLRQHGKLDSFWTDEKRKGRPGQAL